MKQVRNVAYLNEISKTKFLLRKKKKKKFFVSVFAVFKGCYKFLRNLKSYIF